MGADLRFFERLGPLSTADLGASLGFELLGDGTVEVADIAAPEEADVGDLCFVSEKPKAPIKTAGRCVAIIGDSSHADLIEGPSCFLVAQDARAGFGRACAHLLRVRSIAGKVDVDPSAQIAASARIGPSAVIGASAVIGEDVEIGAGAVIGPGVKIGAGTRIGHRAVVQCAVIGERCEIYAGAVIGEAGFGLAFDASGLVSMPHLGRVLMGDEVTIGANSTVDRGMIFDTILSNGCRLDNLCHIGHNVELGEYVVMAAFAGMAGSVKIGAGAQFGGRVGVADHINIGEGSRLAADAAVMRDVPAGETWAGSPAQPIKRFMREAAWLRREANRKRGS